MTVSTNTLREMCELVVDCPHFTPEWTDSGFVVIRNQNIRDGRLDLSNPSFTNRADFDRRNRRAKPKAGDIVFTREAPMGEVCLIPEGLECCIGQRQVLLRPSKDVDGKYLFFALRSPFVRHQIFWNEGTGSTVSNVRIPVLEALKIPRLGTQESAIGALLGALDDKIELNRRMNETLEAMARAIFKDWFVDFGPTRAKIEGRPPYLAPDIWSLFPDRLDGEERPEGWGHKRVDELLELNYGKALRADTRQPGAVPVYGSGGLAGFHNEALVDGPTIIVGRKGTVGSLLWEDGPCFPIDTVFYVVPKVPLTYCFYLLQGLGLEAMNTDAAVPGLNRNNVYRLDATWPGDELCKRFDEIAKALRAKIRANDIESSTLIATRDLLLPKLMSGEIRVKDVEKLVRKVT